MTDVNSSAAPPAAPQSDRVRLAVLAREAALGVPGVVDTDSGPAGLFITTSGPTRTPGVTCVAAAGGGFDVTIRLKCELVALTELAETVRREVLRRATATDLVVSDLRIEIVDVVEPGRA